jgi:choline transporter-like protein 2/4/5
VGCTILLIAAWFAMTMVGFVGVGVIDGCPNGIGKGDPTRLFNGIDYLGNVCGSKNEDSSCPAPNATVSAAGTDMTAKKFTYYPNPSRASFAICVATCPVNTYAPEEKVSSDPRDAVCTYGLSTPTGQYDYTSVSWIFTALTGAETCFPGLKTKAVANYCVPELAGDALMSAMSVAATSASNTSAVFVNAAQEEGLTDKLIADFHNAQGVIFGFGIGVAILLGFVFLQCLRIPVIIDLLIYGIVILIGCFFLALGATFYTKSTDEQAKIPLEKAQTEIDMLKYFGILWLVVGGVYSVVMIFLRKRVALAIAVCKQAARALGHMPLLIVFPVIQSVGLLLFMLPWMYFGSYLMSAGEMISTMIPGNPTPYRVFAYAENVRYALLYYVFIYFWTSQFIVAMGQLVVAMSCAAWYFDRTKGQSNTKVVKALRQAFWYHMGSAAFGSLIIAIIKTIRAIVMYLQNKAKKSGNKAAQMVLCCIQCCMWCLEKVRLLPRSRPLPRRFPRPACSLCCVLCAARKSCFCGVVGCGSGPLRCAGK